MRKGEITSRLEVLSMLMQHEDDVKKLKKLTDEYTDLIKEFSTMKIDIIASQPIDVGLNKRSYSFEAIAKAKSESGFIKLDSGKRRLSLIEPQFINSLGDVITFGAQKYAPGNWRLCEDTSRYKDALLRHIYAYLSGEQQDQETCIDHLAHAACNLMFLQYFDNLKKDQQ